MNYEALATDYDGTLARHGVVSETTLRALHRLKDAGRKLLLVTGRQLAELLGIFPQAALCDCIVAENGALLYLPATGETRLLGPTTPPQFAERLRQRGVAPLSNGHIIVATVVPNETVVLEVIRELGLELQVIFNKEAVMVLPTGINKATGLTAALKELALDPSRVAAVGDAENDHAFLDLCGYSVAVANAIPALRERAHWVTPSTNGAGVAELIQQMLKGEEERATSTAGASSARQ
jgi:hydroxymethylpyrimidine pyrophosphatase-like HAD family hydrolase